MILISLPRSKRKNKKRTSSGGSSSGKQEKQDQKKDVKVEEETSLQGKNKKSTSWSEEEKVEDPDTDDIDLLLLNNYQNYKLKKEGFLHKEGIEELDGGEENENLKVKNAEEDLQFEADPDDDPDGDSDFSDELVEGAGKKKKGWAWRVARIAVPLQFALISLFCVARLFEPQCCDVVNNFSMSFTPHLRYVRGPPPM